MRVYSDVLTAADFCDALEVAPGCVLWKFDGPRPARVRSYRWFVRLAKPGSRRPLNGGEYGAVPRAAGYGAPSYDEWGWWLAELFSRDSGMRAGEYDGVMEFRRLTGEKFPVHRMPVAARDTPAVVALREQAHAAEDERLASSAARLARIREADERRLRRRSAPPSEPEWMAATVAANAARAEADALLRHSRDAEAAGEAAAETVYEVIGRADAVLAEHERLAAVLRRAQEESMARIWVNTLHP